ncbi:unnamed protein product [Spodoptera littoralis]|uniref:Uncharacterized protein n=1 Tax=Spodoptera littoralis TaxID=7109 RepID=A0A9P0HYS5_SPOLI|nr:unnamed protein product [Spodoptera littoralis]CAH1636452.1 unnamed protein product [Spodoptera littoralis]
MERFACPTPDRQGRYRCIDDHVLCDGFIDCPSGEDEDRQACMFYKTVILYLLILLNIHCCMRYESPPRCPGRRATPVGARPLRTDPSRTLTL